MSPLDLAQRLLAAGIPVVAVGPDDKPRQSAWQGLDAADCNLSLYRPGDALAMVGGCGIDAVDVDTKQNGSLDHLPPFKSYGKTQTPSGGAHYIVPSSGLGKIQDLRTPVGFVGDYVGGRADGSSRLLLFLPGSVRTKYPDGGYTEEVPWRIEECLGAEPDPDLVQALETAGGARKSRSDHYVDDSPTAAEPHPYARRAVEGELTRLDELGLLGWGGPGWDSTCFEVACNLVELGNSGWTGYDLEDLHGEFLDRAPADEEFTRKHHEAKWSSAINRVDGGGRKCPDQTAAEAFAGIADDLFEATPVLAHIRDAAHSRLVSAPALLCYVLGRVLVEIPPGVTLPPVVGGRASLNLGIAVVGESGAGKSALLRVSREVLGLTGEWQEDLERGVGSGEGLVQSFLMWDKNQQKNVLIDDPRRILTIDEVDALGAVQGRNGTSIAPTIRTAVSGGPLGQENASADRKRHVPANCYRLVLLIGVQPTRSATLLDDADAGTPQRLVWTMATDPTAPDDRVAWPGPLAVEWEAPDLPDSIEYPDYIKAEVWEARRLQLRGGGDSDKGHMLLTRLKVSAALAVLHGDVDIHAEWWRLAGLVVDTSMAVQADCRRILAEQTAKQRRNAGRLDGMREEGRAAYKDERLEAAAVAIWRKVESHATGAKDGNDQKHEPSEGCTSRCVKTRALRHFADREELFGPALGLAFDYDWIVDRRGRYFPGASRPADENPNRGRLRRGDE